MKALVVLGSLFNKVAGPQDSTLSKKDSSTGVFPVNFFEIVYITTPGNCFWIFRTFSRNSKFTPFSRFVFFKRTSLLRDFFAFSPLSLEGLSYVEYQIEMFVKYRNLFDLIDHTL